MKAENTKDWWSARYEAAGSDFLYAKEPSEFLTQFDALIPKAGKVVDLACGEGRNAIALALKGYEVTAIDFCESAIEKAKSLAAASGAQVEFKVQDLDFFLPELMTYDAIVAIDFKPPPTLIKNLIRGLKKDGHLMMESYLLQMMKRVESLEAFECFKAGELLKNFEGASLNYRVEFYSELGPWKNWGEKAHLIAKKTEML